MLLLLLLQLLFVTSLKHNGLENTIMYLKK